SYGDQAREQGDKAVNKDKVSAAGLDFTNSINDFTAAGPLVSAAKLNFTNSTNDFSAAGPSNAAMPNLEDFPHNVDDVGSGPAWLFDIDSLSQTMNYHPVLTENQSNPTAGFQDTEKAREEGTHTYVLFSMLSDGFINPKNNKDAHTGGNKHNDDIQKSVSPDNHSSSCGDQAWEQVSAAGLDFTNSTNDFTTASPLVSAAELNFTNSTNDFSAAGPSNAAMPNFEDFSHNEDNVGAEADTNHMESIISISPIPTTKIHKDHPTSQIIGDLSSTTQTRSMVRGVRDQGGISQMFNEDFHTYMFTCFLSQEEPKRIHQALKDPSWIEAIQE
nr:hypothetical protein [Tanacetum cinerariifolium]